MNVLYLLKHFPSLSQTFVLRELTVLARRGWPAQVVSALPPTDTMVPLAPELASRTTYLEHDFLYRYAASGRHPDAEVRARFERALEAGGGPVSGEERQRLWEAVAADEPDESWARRGFLDGLHVLQVARAHAVEHLHGDFAEDNVRLAHLVSQASGLPFSFKMRAYDIFAEPRPELRRWAAAARAVFTISEYNREHLCTRLGLPAEKVTVVRDGIPVHEIAPVATYAHRPFTILSVSRLVEKKGHRVLLEACARLARRGLGFRCEILGDGPRRHDLERRIGDLRLEGVVTLRGAVPQAEVMRAFEAASVFVLPCVQASNGDRDGTPNVLMEAMARAVPVVSTRLSGIPEMVDGGREGLLVSPEDADGLAEAVARLAADRELADSLRHRGRRAAEERFPIERTVDGFLGALRARDLAPAVGA